MNKYIGALWLKEANGKSYFSGVLKDLRGDINIVIFPNDRKEQPNQPDYNILLSEPKKSIQPQGFQAPAQPPMPQMMKPISIQKNEIPVIEEGAPTPQPPQPQGQTDEINVADIPF